MSPAKPSRMRLWGSFVCTPDMQAMSQPLKSLCGMSDDTLCAAVLSHSGRNLLTRN